MEVIYKITDAFCKIPEVLSLTAAPILLIVCGFIFAAFGWKRAYPWLCVGLSAAGFALTGARDLSGGLIYLSLMVVLGALGRLFFLIPFGRGTKKERGDELYEKFHRPLDVSEEELALEDEPDQEPVLEEGSELRLSHARELLETLKKSELSASDRLEADALSRTLDGFDEKELSFDETRTLNDCLATILKLTAKYKL